MRVIGDAVINYLVKAYRKVYELPIGEAARLAGINDISLTSTESDRTRAYTAG